MNLDSSKVSLSCMALHFVYPTINFCIRELQFKASPENHAPRLVIVRQIYALGDNSRTNLL